MTIAYGFSPGKSSGRPEGKQYKYRGYTFYATDSTTETRVSRFGISRKEIRPLYQIDGLKDAGVRPFLTSLQQCKDYIDINGGENA